MTTKQATGWTEICLKAGTKALILVESMHSHTPYSKVYIPQGCPLTQREIQIVECVSYGMTNKQVAEKLSLSHLTIKSHLMRIGKEIGTGSRSMIVSIAIQNGWIE